MKYLFKGDAEDNKRQLVILRNGGYYYLTKVIAIVEQHGGVYTIKCMVKKPDGDPVITELHLFETHRIRLAGVFGELKSRNYTFTEVVNIFLEEGQTIPFQVKEYVSKKDNVYVNPHFIHEIPKGTRA